MVHLGHKNIKLIKEFYHLIGNYFQDYNSILYLLIQLNYRKRNKLCLFLEIFKEISGLLIKGLCKLVLCLNGLGIIVLILSGN
jgi:hypothetical protein